jgi:hypothetical protein
VAIEYRSYVDRLTNGINRNVAARLLQVAQQDVLRWTHPGYKPAFGEEKPAPVDAWQQSFRLRQALLDLYRLAADSHGARSLLDYECNLDDREQASSFLDYLLSERVVANLRIPEQGFPVVREGPRFTRLLTDEAANILKLDGAPDDLGCLTLLLVMETDDLELHDAALERMRALIARTRNTTWETEARIAHAIVRYYYVVRHGWSRVARYYAIGDDMGRGLIRMGDERLDAAFGDNEYEPRFIGGIDPIAEPYEWMGGETRLVRTLLLSNPPPSGNSLPKLSRQCETYWAVAYPAGTQYTARSTVTFPSNIDSISWERVADAETLLRMAASGRVREFAERYRIVVTERTFERVLGHRSVVRAHGRRNGTSVDGDIDLLAPVDALLAQCQAGLPLHDSHARQIYVAPVYDNPPRRVGSAPPPGSWTRFPFTLPPDKLEEVAWRISLENERHANAIMRERLYTTRDNEFALSCLLALQRGAPIFTYYWRKAVTIQTMGIGSAHPDTVTLNNPYVHGF